jgi:hypothetical protein
VLEVSSSYSPCRTSFHHDSLAALDPEVREVYIKDNHLIIALPSEPNLSNHIKPNEQGIRLHDDVYVYLLQEVPVARVFESVNMTHTAVTASPWHTALIKLTIPPRMNGRTSSLGNLSKSGPN